MKQVRVACKIILSLESVVMIVFTHTFNLFPLFQRCCPECMKSQFHSRADISSINTSPLHHETDSHSQFQVIPCQHLYLNYCRNLQLMMRVSMCVVTTWKCLKFLPSPVPSFDKDHSNHVHFPVSDATPPPPSLRSTQYLITPTEKKNNGKYVCLYVWLCHSSTYFQKEHSSYTSFLQFYFSDYNTWRKGQYIVMCTTRHSQTSANSEWPNKRKY